MVWLLQTIEYSDISSIHTIILKNILVTKWNTPDNTHDDTHQHVDAYQGVWKALTMIRFDTL